MHKSRGKLVVGLVAIAAASAVAAPAAAGAGESASDAATPIVVHQGQFGADGTVAYTSHEVAARVGMAPAVGKPATPAPAKPSKLHPALAAALAQPATNTRHKVIVTFQDDMTVPRMPNPDQTQPRSAEVNVRAKAKADALVAGVKAQRRPGYQAIGSQLARLDIRTLDTYWLIKGIVADAPLSSLPALVGRDDVLSVEPVATDTPPPVDADPDNDPVDARAHMRTDPYFNLGLTSGWIGLLDTGVRNTHTLFNSPTHLDFQEDLTGGGNPDDDCWNHGTASAAILTGNSNLGFNHRGVTAITVDSFKIYPAGCGGLDISAAIAGFERAVNVLDRVIVSETQPGGTETSALSVAADAAYDAGAVVIAANGNFGPNPSTVAVPAVAQKALGIGAVDVKTLATPSYQGRGPAPDGRIKPDVQAPTNVETASSASTTATQVFTGTSCATPHAAGAAALARNFLRGSAFDIDPGQVYAYMIANGTVAYPFNNTTGAGLVKLGVNGYFWRSSASVGNLQTIEIPISVAATNNRMNVALWWPEQPATHNDVDLSIIDPSGVVRASSVSIPSVFERVSVAGPLAAGTWRIRIHGYSVPGGSQLVHWTAVTSP